MENPKSHLETPLKESPSKKAKSTTPSPIQSSPPKVDVTPPAAEPTKSRRKRKQIVTKRMTNDDCMDDLRTDYSETAMDIESDLSAERLNESLQSLKSPQKPIPTTPIPLTQPIQITDSDECETIDKIAEMVSDMTNKSDPSKSISIEDPAEKSAHEIMEEVENRLEEMFADPNEPTPSTSKAANEENPKKESLESLEVVPATSAKKKKVKPKKETTKVKKQPVNGKAAKEAKNGKKGKNAVANGTVRF